MATEKSLNKFVVDTMLAQRDDIRAIIGFITRDGFESSVIIK